MQTVIIQLRQEKMVTCSAERVTKGTNTVIVPKIFKKYKRKFFGTLALLSAIALIGVPNALDFGQITLRQAIFASVLSLLSFVAFAGLGGAFNE